ncbi:hypothetical protein K7X86_00275, partial [Candidatus Sulcia muelleri]|nr:hypothetical protein [Candidatus Karelsulcia muelleri]
SLRFVLLAIYYSSTVCIYFVDCQKWWLPLLSKKAATDSCKKEEEEEEEEEKWNKLALVGREENGRCNEVIVYLIT